MTLNRKAEIKMVLKHKLNKDKTQIPTDIFWSTAQRLILLNKKHYKREGQPTHFNIKRADCKVEF